MHIMHILLPFFIRCSDCQQVIKGATFVIEGTNVVISAVSVVATQLGYAKVQVSIPLELASMARSIWDGRHF